MFLAIQFIFLFLFLFRKKLQKKLKIVFFISYCIFVIFVSIQVWFEVKSIPSILEPFANITVQNVVDTTLLKLQPLVIISLFLLFYFLVTSISEFKANYNNEEKYNAN